MTGASRHDAWNAGDNYDSYMGRWSRKLAPLFIDWLRPSDGLDWLDVGCGTGALSGAILTRCEPNSLIGVDPSEGFVAKARASLADPKAEFLTGDAQALPLADSSRDAVVSALVLNFVPDRPKALREMQRVTRPGGIVGFYVWDYPGGGIELMRRFWRAAIELEPGAADLTEDRRFPFCTAEGLTELAEASGLAGVTCAPIEMETVFLNFEDYWHPFTLGTGPAPGYLTSLSEHAQQALRRKLEDTLPRREDGSIALRARAWGVKGIVP